MAKKNTPTTVLIVDDEALFRSSTADALVAACPDYTVLQAAHGKEALEWIDAGVVDVVVTDVSMPVMDGLDLLLELRQRQYLGPTIVVTAFGNPRLESDVIQLGAFHYVEKPVDLPHLIQLIRGAVQGERSQIQGLTLVGFVQLLALEQKTCRLRVTKNDIHGDLLFRNGDLVDAKLGGLVGEPAALELLAWEEGTRLDLFSGIRSRKKRIQPSLNQLLLEAMHNKDRDRGKLQRREHAAPGPEQRRKEPEMGNVKESLREIMSIDGAVGVALVDHESGMSLGQAGGGDLLNLEVAGAGNTTVVRSKMKVMRDLGLDDTIEDILITLGKQYHLIRPLASAPNLFLYLALIRDRANLAMARHQLMAVEKKLAL